jgi:DNA/RNA endonuclease YhcR with UshA esterase domain
VPIAPGAVVINEIAWGGTKAGAEDEWLELYNTTALTITLDGWRITSARGLNLNLSGTRIGPHSYYLIERTDDSPVNPIPADLTTSFGRGLNNGGDALWLWVDQTAIDSANVSGGPWPAGSGAPQYFSMERIDPLAPDTPANWAANDGFIRAGFDAAGMPINGTPKEANSTRILLATATPLPTETATPSPTIELTATLSPTVELTPTPTTTPSPPPTVPPSRPVLISEFLYDGLTPGAEGDEFVELCNPNAVAVDLTGYKIGDEETPGSGESMYRLPDNTGLPAAGCLVIAKSAADFAARFGFQPELATGHLAKYTAWGRGSWSLANTGDEIVLLGPDDQIVDSVAFRNGDYAAVGLTGEATAPQPHSLQRVWPDDSNSMPNDFVRTDPNPGQATWPPPPPTEPPLAAALPDGMHAYWGQLHAHTTYSDGAGPPGFALATARAAGLHFYALTDHDWWLTDAEWANLLTQTEAATAPGEFVALRGEEWTHEAVGHINIFNSSTLVSARHPLFADLPALYAWLAANPHVIAQFNHPDVRYDGDFNHFAFNPAAAPMMFMQEMVNNAQQYTTYETAFIKSNLAGWKVGPTANGDTHTAQWGHDMTARTGLVAAELTAPALLDALRARRIFSTEDSNLALTLQAGGAWMGSTLPPSDALAVTVRAIDPDREPVTLYLYDNTLLLDSVTLNGAVTDWPATVIALPGHFLWVKAVQADGDLAYTTPLWFEGNAPPDIVQLNEIMAAPVKGKGEHSPSGVAEEWLELYNPMDRPVGLGGWRLVDAAGAGYDIPLGVTLPPGGFVTFTHAQTGIGLNNDRETVTLLHPNGAAIDSFSYEHGPGYDQTWCRLPEQGLAWADGCVPSPNEPNWQMPARAPLKVKIFEAKRLTYGAWVKVTGQVTAPPGLMGARMMYIQDATSGVLIYLPKDHRLAFQPGDRVEVEGTLRQFHEEAEIAVSERGKVRFLGHDQPVPPLPIATTSLLEPYEGLLVQLQGQAVRFKGSTTLWVDDGTDPAQVYIRRSTGIRKPYLRAGTSLTVVGVVSQYSEADEATRFDYRLLPRYQIDLVVPEVAPKTSSPPAGWPKKLPNTGF